MWVAARGMVSQVVMYRIRLRVNKMVGRDAWSVPSLSL